MSNTSPLMDLLFAGARQKVLAVLLLQPSEGFHLRELARLTASHAGTLGRELDKLTEAGLLLRSEQGNLVRYQANRNCPLFDELSAMFRKTHGAAALLRDALEPLADRIRFALIFGSVAKGAQSSRSDIDVLVVGEVGFSELIQSLFPAQQTLQREINPVLYSAEEYRARARRCETLVREVVNNPVVFLKGDRDDLAELAGDQATTSARR
jgi:predicted nucleotidyltransferase